MDGRCGIALSQGTSLALTAGAGQQGFTGIISGRPFTHSYLYTWVQHQHGCTGGCQAGRKAGVKHRFFDLDNENFIREIKAFFRKSIHPMKAT